MAALTKALMDEAVRGKKEGERARAEVRNNGENKIVRTEPRPEYHLSYSKNVLNEFVVSVAAAAAVTVVVTVVVNLLHSSFR